MWTGKVLIKKNIWSPSQEWRAVWGLKAAGRHISEAHLALLARFERLISQITSRLVSA